MIEKHAYSSSVERQLLDRKFCDTYSRNFESKNKLYNFNMSINDREFRFKVSEHGDKHDDVFYDSKVMGYEKEELELKWRKKEYENNHFRRWHEKRGSYSAEEVGCPGVDGPKKEFYLSSAERQYPHLKNHNSRGPSSVERDDLEYRRSDQKMALDVRSGRLHHNGLLSPHPPVVGDRSGGQPLGRDYDSSAVTMTATHPQHTSQRTFSCQSDFDLMNGCNVAEIRPQLTRCISTTSDRQEIGSLQISNKRSLSLTPVQDDGMMAANGEDSIINLSSREASNGPAGDPTWDSSLEQQAMGHTNGDTDSQELNSPQGPTTKCLSAGSPGIKRKSRSSGDTSGRTSPSLNGMHQSVLMLAAQHGLTPAQIQQMLVAQQGAVTQQLMQAQQSVAMQQQQKAHEQALVQLNEQLQLNMLQQAQLLQNQKLDGKKGQQQLQSLGIQHQQIMQNIQQLQLQQRQLLVACLMSQPFSAQNTAGVMASGDLHQMWKDLSSSQNNCEEGIKPGLNGLNLGAMNGSGTPLLSGSSMMGLNGMTQETFPFTGPLVGQPQVKQEEGGYSALYKHGMCKWPGCDTECHDHSMFLKHLNNEHTLDDKNTAQARVQMQIVNQLEMQLTREKELLHAMMQHLHLNPQMDGREDRGFDRKMSDKMMSSPKMVPSLSPVKPIANCLGASSLHKPSLPPRPMKDSLPLHRLTPVGSGLSPLIIPPQTSLTSATPVTSGGHHQTTSQPATPTGLGPMRRRVSDKCNLPISAEIQRNREFYKNTDVRPPFTYASLIRQAIIESENKQLTLNEVYQWFQNTFAYFRRNEATWKNAVRHNLSLHKCFMRVENVKGAVWTVDEVEFYKRRPQKLTGAIPGSPSLASEAAMYGDTLNASLRAALEQNGLLGGYHVSNGSLSDGGAEDLSMKSHGNSNDSFDKSQSPSREESMFTKPFMYPSEDQSRISPKDYSTQGLDLSPRSGGQSSPLEDQHSPRGRRSSPMAHNSPNGKVFMQGAHGLEPMEVQQYVGGSPQERQQNNQGYQSAGESNVAAQAQKENLNFKMVAPHLQMTHYEQTEALNMKQEVEMNNKYESHRLHLTPRDKSPQTEQVHTDVDETQVKVKVEVSEVGEDLSSRSRSRSPVERDVGNDTAKSPKSDRQSPAEQILTNQGLFSPLLHGNSVSSAVVSHSMS